MNNCAKGLRNDVGERMNGNGGINKIFMAIIAVLVFIVGGLGGYTQSLQESKTETRAIVDREVKPALQDIRERLVRIEAKLDRQTGG